MNLGIIYLSNTKGTHFDLLYGINDPIIQELELENHNETRKREDKQNSDENKRQELLTNINTIIFQQEQQEGNDPNEQGQIANIQPTINDILQETELSNATLAQLSLINDIYEATKEEKSQSREAAREATIKRKETKTHDTKDDKTDVGNTQEVIENYAKLCFELAISEIMTLRGTVPNQIQTIF